ncbi:MAG: hypothetical protein QXD77_01080 [Candidatus Aenigmatarchaeota archaeon]
MVRLSASLHNCTELEETLRGMNVNEIALLDTNVIISGAFPYTRKEKYRQRFYSEERLYKQKSKSWREGVKYQVAILDWMLDWRGYGRRVAPFITKTMHDEVFEVYGKENGEFKSAKRMFGMLRDIPRAFYVLLHENSELPQEVSERIAKYMKREDGSDMCLLGAAFSLNRNTKFKVGVVSDDWDFNRAVEIELEKYKTEDGRSVLLENSESFVKRLQLPLPIPPQKKKRHAEA